MFARQFLYSLGYHHSPEFLILSISQTSHPLTYGSSLVFFSSLLPLSIAYPTFLFLPWQFLQFIHHTSSDLFLLQSEIFLTNFSLSVSFSLEFQKKVRVTYLHHYYHSSMTAKGLTVSGTEAEFMAHVLFKASNARRRKIYSIFFPAHISTMILGSPKLSEAHFYTLSYVSIMYINKQCNCP